jgi:hypothetical protein
MVDQNFSIDAVVPPKKANADRLVYTTGMSGDGKSVVLAEHQMSVNEIGEMSSPTGEVTFANAVNVVSRGGTQTVVANGPLISINLELGTSIILNQSASTQIQFAGLPTKGYKFFDIIRVHDATTNVYSLLFLHSPPTYTWLKEGSNSLVMSQTANSEDRIIGWVNHLGETTTIMPRMKYGTGTPILLDVVGVKQITSYQTKQANQRAVVSGQSITTSTDGTLNAVDLMTDGIATFTATTELYDNMINKLNMVPVTKASSDTLTINMNTETNIILNQNSDINTIEVIPAEPDYPSLCRIKRIKDNTSTPRLINFDPTVFDRDVEPLLTQTANGIDYIFILSFSGINILTVLNYFG